MWLITDTPFTFVNKSTQMPEILEQPQVEKSEIESILTSSKEIKTEIPLNVDEILTKGLRKEPEVVVEEQKPEEVTVEVVETPEQIKVREQAKKIEEINADLKLNKEEKEKAVAELIDIKKPKKYWEEQSEPEASGEIKNEPTEDKQYKAFEAKAKEYDEILKDPAVEAIITARKAGKDFTQFIKEVQPIDIDKLSYEDLQREQLRRENPDPAYIEKGMEEFAELSDRAKLKETKEIKAALNAEQHNRLSQYSLDNRKAAIAQEEWVVNLNKEKEQYLESIKGKVKEGVEITSARLPELQKDFEGFNLRRKDGTLDVPRIMRIILLEKYNSLRLENAYQQGATEKEIEWRDKTSRPSASNGITVAPEVKNKSTKQTEDQANLKTFDQLTQVRGRGERVV